MPNATERQTPHCPECGNIVTKDAHGEVFVCDCGVTTFSPLWYSSEELDIHDAGECHKDSEPCAICGKSAQDGA